MIEATTVKQPFVIEQIIHMIDFTENKTVKRHHENLLYMIHLKIKSIKTLIEYSGCKLCMATSIVPTRNLKPPEGTVTERFLCLQGTKGGISKCSEPNCCYLYISPLKLLILYLIIIKKKCRVNCNHHTQHFVFDITFGINTTCITATE